MSPRSLTYCVVHAWRHRVQAKKRKKTATMRARSLNIKAITKTCVLFGSSAHKSPLLRSFARAVHQVRRPIFLRGANGMAKSGKFPFAVSIGLRGVAKFKPFLWPIDRCAPRWPDEQPSGMGTNYAAGYRVAFRGSRWAVVPISIATLARACAIRQSLLGGSWVRELRQPTRPAQDHARGHVQPRATAPPHASWRRCYKSRRLGVGPAATAVRGPTVFRRHAFTVPPHRGEPIACWRICVFRHLHGRAHERFNRA